LIEQEEIMQENCDIGTLDGKPITQAMLKDFTLAFERDWTSAEVNIALTERGKALRALQDLNIPPYEIEALERRAKQKEQPLSLFVHAVLQSELLAANE
jgi:hypothetical protein